MPNRPSPLISTSELAEALDQPDLRIVDASVAPIGIRDDPKARYRAEHLPEAVFFDLDEICDKRSGLPHMLPRPEHFASAVRKLGLGDGVRIVIYDQYGIYSAARAWWTFRVMGHEDVQVLDGGLPKWRAEGRILEDIPPLPRERHYTPRFRNELVRDKSQLLRNLALRPNAALPEVIIDARSHARFLAQAPEPRPGLRGGHMPGAKSLPFGELINADGCLKKGDGLREVFARHRIDPTARIVTSCGSGLTAAIINLALAELGNRQAALYDGSWAEWGADPACPIASEASDA